MFGGNWTALPEIEEDGIPKPEPPKATPVNLPKLPIIKPAKVIYNKHDSVIVSHIRTKFAHFNIKRLTQRDLRKLNISSTSVLPLDEILVLEHLPPTAWSSPPESPPTFVWETKPGSYPAFLLNGVRRPEHYQFFNFSQELLADLKDVYHSLRRDPPKEGYSTISIRSFRKFFLALHGVGTYWDDSLDNVEPLLERSATIERSLTTSDQDQSSTITQDLVSAKNSTTSSIARPVLEDETPLDTSDMDMDDFETEDDLESALSDASTGKTLWYTGRRTSTGTRMPARMAMDMAEAFLEPIMYAFGCHFDQISRGDQRLFMIDSVMLCSNTKFIYTRPKEDNAAKRGILEGPIAVLHAYACTNFDSVDEQNHGSPIKEEQDEGVRQGHFDAEVHVNAPTSGNMEHFFRELKALLLCAHERSRFNKLPIEPGNGEWWSRPWEKWGKANDNGAGDKPGEAVGRPLTDLDLFPSGGLQPTTPASLFASAQQNLAAHLKKMTTEDESDWRPSGRSDQEGIHSTSSEDYDGGVDQSTKLSKTRKEEIEAWTEKNSPLEPIDTSTYSYAISEDTSSDQESPTGNHTPTTPTRKRSFSTFAGPGDIIVASDASDSLSPESGKVDSQNRDVEGVLDMDAEWKSPSRSPINQNVASSKLTSQTLIEHNGLPTHYSSRVSSEQPADIEPPLKSLSREELRKEWYRVKLMEERQSQDYEKRKRIVGVVKGNKRGKTMFPKTRNEYKRIGVHPEALQDEIYLISVVNHHIAFIHMRIHTHMIEWMSPNPREREEVAAMEKDTDTWWGLPLRRSKWFNLFDGNDRVEAMKGAWAIFGRMLADPPSDNEAAMLARHEIYGSEKKMDKGAEEQELATSSSV